VEINRRFGMEKENYRLKTADWIMILLLAAIIGLLIATSGCSLISEEQKTQAKDAISKQITPENVEKIKEILK
jgi:hypothetical protein